MKPLFIALITIQVLGFSLFSYAAAPPAAPGESGTTPDNIENASLTSHTININGRPLSYRATAGLMTIDNESGDLIAKMFYVAYTKDNEPNLSTRPVTFAFNGGPGAASIWLHMGMMGPRRAVLMDNGTALPTSYELVDNAYTWLDFTDLVLVDPVGTGFSRAADPAKAKQFYNLQEDARLMAEFIRLYVTNNQRWLSPKIIAGESYGTTRAVKLVGVLQNDHGMLINGLVLLSTALNFEVFSFDRGNDLAFALAVPSYAAAAWYHEKLLPDLQGNLSDTLSQVQDWTIRHYLPALAQGADLADSERQSIGEELSRYTGLSSAYVRRSRMRVPNYRYTTELLRDSGFIIGMLDSRVKAPSVSGVSEYPYQDPSLFIVEGPYTAMFNQYVREDLGFNTDLEYLALSETVNRSWQWSKGQQGYVDVTEILAQAMSLNQQLRVLAASGYFDLTTPWLSQAYTLTHLGIRPSLRSHITHTYYEAGHQIYTSIPALKKLTRDVSRFYRDRATQ